MGESTLPTMAIIFELKLFKIGISRRHSTVEPLLEMRIVGSPGS